MKKHIEINAGEGGRDAELLVEDMATAYMKLSQRRN